MESKRIRPSDTRISDVLNALHAKYTDGGWKSGFAFTAMQQASSVVDALTYVQRTVPPGAMLDTEADFIARFMDEARAVVKGGAK